MKERDPKLQGHCAHIGDVEVVRVLYYCASGKRKGTWALEEITRGMHQLPALASDDCNLLQKHWEWQEERAPMMNHGSVIRPTLCLASLDIKTAFDEARPRHVAKVRVMTHKDG